MRIERFEEIDSTSLEARRRTGEVARAGVPVAFVARVQTGGLGRLGRRWESPEGGLWFTLAWPLQTGVPLPDALGLRVGVACARAIEQVVQSHMGGSRPGVELKWPNDVLIGGRKALGVLCECVSAGGSNVALVGVGANANVALDDLPAELRERSTSLLAVLGGSVDLGAAFDGLLAELRRVFEQREPLPVVVREARRMLARGRGGWVELPGGARRPGAVEGLTDSGSLVLRSGDEVWEAPIGSAFTTAAPAAPPPLH